VKRLVSLALLAALPLVVACPSSPGEDPSAVQATMQVAWWQADGSVLWRTGSRGTGTWSALVPEGTGWREVPATPGSGESLTVPGVGPGTYYLKRDSGFGVDLFEQASLRVDLGWDFVGRPDGAPVAQPTVLDVDATNLAPWGRHSLGLEAPGLGGAVVPASEAVAVGATSGHFAFDLQGRSLPVAGDRAWLVQRVHTGTLSRGATQVVGVAALPTLPAVAVGGTASLGPVALVAPQAFGEMTLDVRLDEFAALVPPVEGITVSPSGAQVWVMASPHYAGTVGAIWLHWERFPSGGANPPPVTVRWPRFVPDAYQEFRETAVSALAGMAPSLGAPVADVPLGLSMRIERVSGADPILRPRLGPPRAPRVAGLDASKAQAGVGLTPTVSWSPPSLGTPSRYELGLFDRTSGSPVNWRATVRTTATSFSLPPGLLEAGHVYGLVLAAVSEPNAAPSAPFRSTLPFEQAGTLTAAFTP